MFGPSDWLREALVSGWLTLNEIADGTNTGMWDTSLSFETLLENLLRKDSSKGHLYSTKVRKPTERKRHVSICLSWRMFYFNSFVLRLFTQIVNYNSLMETCWCIKVITLVDGVCPWVPVSLLTYDDIKCIAFHDVVRTKWWMHSFSLCDWQSISEKRWSSFVFEVHPSMEKFGLLKMSSRQTCCASRI